MLNAFVLSFLFSFHLIFLLPGREILNRECAREKLLGRLGHPSASNLFHSFLNSGYRSTTKRANIPRENAYTRCSWNNKEVSRRQDSRMVLSMVPLSRDTHTRMGARETTKFFCD